MEIPDEQRPLRQLQDREHVLMAIVHAVESWKEVLTIISDAADESAACRALAEALKLDEVQATAVLDVQFRRVSRAARERLIVELRQIRGEIARLSAAAE